MTVEGENKSPCLCFISSLKQVERGMGSERGRGGAAPPARTAGGGPGRAWHRLPGEFTWSEPSWGLDTTAKRGVGSPNHVGGVSLLCSLLVKLEILHHFTLHMHGGSVLPPSGFRALWALQTVTEVVRGEPAPDDQRTPPGLFSHKPVRFSFGELLLLLLTIVQII